MVPEAVPREGHALRLGADLPSQGSLVATVRTDARDVPAGDDYRIEVRQGGLSLRVRSLRRCGVSQARLHLGRLCVS